MSINEVCKALGATDRTVRSMARRRELPALPNTGGQGRRLLFDAQAVSDYASNADLGRILARAALGRMTNKIAESATHYWHHFYHYNPGKPEHGPRDIRGLEFFGVFPDLPPGHRLIKHDPLPHMPPYYSGIEISYDELTSRACSIARQLTRRECEYLIAALICVAHPAASTRGKTSKKSPAESAQRWEEYVARRKAKGKSPFSAMVLFWNAVPSIVFSRTPEEKAIISDYDLLHVLNKSPKARKYRAQVRRICNTLGISIDLLAKDAEKRDRIKDLGMRLPPASAVGRMMNIKRAQAAILWRKIRSKMDDESLLWFYNLCDTEHRGHLPEKPAPHKRRPTIAAKPGKGGQTEFIGEHQAARFAGMKNICPYCGSPEDKDRASCPYCGQFYEIAPVYTRKVR